MTEKQTKKPAKALKMSPSLATVIMTSQWLWHHFHCFRAMSECVLWPGRPHRPDYMPWRLIWPQQENKMTSWTERVLLYADAAAKSGCINQEETEKSILFQLLSPNVGHYHFTSFILPNATVTLAQISFFQISMSIMILWFLSHQGCE